MARMKLVLQAYVALCVFGLCVCRHRKRSQHKDEQNILMQHAVKTLLGFKEVPRRDSGNVPSPYNTKVAPKFMLDLYQKYKDGKIRSGRQTANTVRSIQADIGEYPIFPSISSPANTHCLYVVPICDFVQRLNSSMILVCSPVHQLGEKKPGSKFNRLDRKISRCSAYASVVVQWMRCSHFPINKANSLTAVSDVCTWMYMYL